MPRQLKGNLYQARGKWRVRISIGTKARPSITLKTCTLEDEEKAIARRDLLVELGAKLGAIPHVPADVAVGLLKRAAERDGKALQAVRDAVDTIVRGEAHPRPAPAPAAPTAAVTFQAFGERWTSGELARLYPDHVKVKLSASTDVGRLELHVYPIVGSVPLPAFSLDDAERVMRSLPPRSAATRRHVAQLMHRLLGIAVFPARLIPANPLPKGFLPKLGAGKAKGWLYPDEDARLMACPAVPLCWRVFWGVLDREGPRASEAAGLDCSDVDLERGVLTLDRNKTDDPRAFVLSPGVMRGLRAWLELRGNPAPDAPLFIGEDGERIQTQDDHLAARFRAHLQAAKVERAELFERSKARQPIRAHDLRATFITISLANGKSETWVADRTGHKSSLMINRYRRAARTAAELELGELTPLDEAIPELRGVLATGSGNGGSDGGIRTPRTRRKAQGSHIVAPPGFEPGRPCGPRILKPGWRTRTGPNRRIRPKVKGRLARIDASAGSRCQVPTGTLPEPHDGPTGPDACPETSPSPRSPGDLAATPPLEPTADRSVVQVVGAEPIDVAPRTVAARAAPPVEASPRAVLLAQLGEALRVAAAAGDIEGARVLLEAIARLHDGPAASGESSGVAPVLDLAPDRARRGGR